MSHALKIESLNITESKADLLKEVLEQFLTDLGYSNDRISNLECRSRDGFAPYSHNFGGLEAICFQDQYMARMNGMPFPNAEATLEKYYEYDFKYWLEQNDKPEDYEMTDSDWDNFDEYQMNDSEATCLYSVDLMLTSETSLNVRICVCVKDAPYHRQYDDLITFDIEFKTASGLKRKLDALLKNEQVKDFKKLVREGF